MKNSAQIQQKHLKAPKWDFLSPSPHLCNSSANTKLEFVENFHVQN